MSDEQRDAPAGRRDASGEERVFFPGDDRLEGMLGRSQDDVVAGGVVIAHPYPLHGATMALPVVYRIAKSCRERHLATLRFNFRGVEGSLGTFSGTEEHRDVAAATEFLRGRLAGLDGDAVPGPTTLPVALAGYSFGSIMAARAAAGLGYVRALALVGFAVDWSDVPIDTYEKLAEFRGPVLALCAENDEIGNPKRVERVLQSLDLDYTLGVVEGSDHFLQGRHREVGERVADFLAEALARPAD
ncbi:MAG: hypothetical protein JW990_11310 [Thermoleophilia bacterium]|nr:hypothetical protein [Thermoleophilia bacterium]